ncbi:ATP-binding cassette domain-containing protein [Streptomyces gilvifuscus]|uniref:ATP-binding cassette domain-containing protein n=1 Tax=Streptomyces gilvifuscus TaxID=1550617 RepID=A0ABT5G937_9ACTN|nr:ATP-binding cassette domain-containing protein [Streptomyces gilvifuscus]MDC2961091.1 ATP-binding cassette domain-containing protein [Streptomyces gilvifuscus]
MTAGPARTSQGPRTGAAITARGLRKAYGEHRVLDGVDLSIPEGSVFSLLGPNGAGKTTTVKILSTLTEADSGEVTVLGRDLAADPDGVRASIGVTGQFSAVDPFLTAAENLALMGRLWHLDRAVARERCARLLEQFDLAEAGRKPVVTFSGGMKRRLDLAMTLVGAPRLIFLDEPTTGLDPRVRRAMWDLIRELVADGVTIFLTTQYLEEADQLADRIAVLDGGRLVAQGTPEELKRRIPGGSVDLRFTSEHALAAAQRALAGLPLSRDDDALTLRVPSDGSAASVQVVLGRLDVATVDELALKTPDLDDVFLALTGRGTTAADTLPGDRKKVLA